MRFWLLPRASGLKRNLLHRDARGSMILIVYQYERLRGTSDQPSHVIADQTEPGDARIRLHDPPQSRLRVLRHGIGFIEDD